MSLTKQEYANMLKAHDAYKKAMGRYIVGCLIEDRVPSTGLGCIEANNMVRGTTWNVGELIMASKSSRSLQQQAWKQFHKNNR